MKARLLTALIGFSILFPVLFFSHTLVLPFAVALFAAMGVWEMLSCIGVQKHKEITIPTLLLAVIIPFAARTITQAKSASFFMTLFAALAFIYLFYLLSLAVVSKGTKSVTDMALTYVMVLYVIVGFTSLVALRDMQFGYYNFIIVFAGPWVADGAAYFVGRAFGKHKLIPDVSPKKTVEGAVGGIVFGAVSLIVVGLIAKACSSLQPNYLELFVVGLILSIISIFGDLIASLLKRHYEIKDFGSIFPGHGGVMDRFDSIVATAPFLLMLCSHPDIFTIFQIG